MYNHSTFEKEYLTDILVISSICDMSCFSEGKKKTFRKREKFRFNKRQALFPFRKKQGVWHPTAFAIPPLPTPLRRGHISHSNEHGLQNN